MPRVTSQVWGVSSKSVTARSFPCVRENCRQYTRIRLPFSCKNLLVGPSSILGFTIFIISVGRSCDIPVANNGSAGEACSRRRRQSSSPVNTTHNFIFGFVNRSSRVRVCQPVLTWQERKTFFASVRSVHTRSFFLFFYLLELLDSSADAQTKQPQ